MAFTLVWSFCAWKVAFLETFQGHLRVISKQPLAGPNSNFMFFQWCLKTCAFHDKEWLLKMFQEMSIVFRAKPIGSFCESQAHVFFFWFFWFLCAKESAKIIWKSKIMWKPKFETRTTWCALWFYCLCLYFTGLFFLK